MHGCHKYTDWPVLYYEAQKVFAVIEDQVLPHSLLTTKLKIVIVLIMV